jgi:hypothetical protein
MTVCSGALGAATGLDRASAKAAVGRVIGVPIRAAKTRRGLLP